MGKVSVWYEVACTFFLFFRSPGPAVLMHDESPVLLVGHMTYYSV